MVNDILSARNIYFMIPEEESRELEALREFLSERLFQYLEMNCDFSNDLNENRHMCRSLLKKLRRLNKYPLIIVDGSTLDYDSVIKKNLLQDSILNNNAPKKKRKYQSDVSCISLKQLFSDDLMKKFNLDNKTK